MKKVKLNIPKFVKHWIFRNAFKNNRKTEGTKKCTLYNCRDFLFVFHKQNKLEFSTNALKFELVLV